MYALESYLRGNSVRAGARYWHRKPIYPCILLFQSRMRALPPLTPQSSPVVAHHERERAVFSVIAGGDYPLRKQGYIARPQSSRVIDYGSFLRAKMPPRGDGKESMVLE